MEARCRSGPLTARARAHAGQGRGQIEEGEVHNLPAAAAFAGFEAPTPTVMTLQAHRPLSHIALQHYDISGSAKPLRVLLGVIL